MAKGRSMGGRCFPPPTWVLALLLLLVPAGAAAQEDAMTPEAASAALSVLGSIFLADHTGYGTTGVFNTKDGAWVRDPEHGLTYVCTVEAAVMPTTPGAQTGVAYGSQVQVFVDPESGRVRITGGDSHGWSRSEMPIADLHERFPSEPPPAETPPPETAGADAPGNDPGGGDAVDALAGLLGILAGELGRVSGETVAVAEPPPEVPAAPDEPEPPSPSTPHESPPVMNPPESPVAPHDRTPPDDTPPSSPPDSPPSPTEPTPPPPGPDETPPAPPPRNPLEQILDEHDPGTPAEPPCHVRQPGEILSFDDCVTSVDLGDPSQIPQDTRTPEERDEAARQQYEAYMQMIQQVQGQSGSTP